MGAVLAEWGKAWTLRSPVLCLAAVVPVAATVAFALGNDAARSTAMTASAGPTIPESVSTVMPIGPASTAAQIAMLVVGAVAMLLVTSEYQGGTIATTLLASPRRGVLVLAKSLVAAALGAGVGGVAGAAAYAAAAFGLSETPDIADLLAFSARAASLSAISAILVVGLAFVLRRSVGTLTASVIVLLAGLALPDSTRPWTASGGIAAFLEGDRSTYPSLIAFSVVAAWTATAALAGVVVVRRRDA